jgi:site-specific DNA-methyltransferase (adenine-specific)
MPTKKEKAKSKPDAKPKAKEWNVVWKDPNELTPYEKNARKNDATVPYLVNSIKRFGFRVPLVIDAKGVVVCGHTRLKAALNMGMKKVPCVVADDLTNAEIKAFRLADNKIAEMSGWDFEALDLELEELKIDFDGDMIDFGFNGGSDDEIDDLNNGDFGVGDKQGTPLESFDVTFTFPIECEEQVKAFIQDKGKKYIVEKIMKEAENVKRD